MKSQDLKKLKLPDTPGVYIFRDYQRRPLYIGRATSLRDRTKSYFSIDLIDTRGPRIVDMVTKAKSVTWQETDSVLEAILLESALIKKYQPYYNVDERDDKSALMIAITDEEWPRVVLVRERDKVPFKIMKKFGPFVQAGLIKESLKILRKMFPFRDEKSNDIRHDNFYRTIGRSPDNVDSENYQKTIRNLIMFFDGRKKQLRAKLNREMKAYAKVMAFEKADEVKKLLYAIDHIRDISLIKKQENGKVRLEIGRMEAYDIAHISGTNVVGAFVVSVNGEFEKSQYRKFILSTQENNDVKNLKEILNRRLNHTEWAYPDLIIVDGGEAQVNAAKEVLSARRVNLPVVGVVKNDRHKAKVVIGDVYDFKDYLKDIVNLNKEAHRFVVSFHRKKRGKMV